VVVTAEPATDVVSPPSAGRRAALSVPALIFDALVVLIVADGAKLTPLVLVQVKVLGAAKVQSPPIVVPEIVVPLPE
jgi:hypothetical protein